jgi:hypothetical protein
MLPGEGDNLQVFTWEIPAANITQASDVAPCLCWNTEVQIQIHVYESSIFTSASKTTLKIYVYL